MTNKHMVEEINRQIRGIAMNYPDGLHLIRQQLDQLAPPNPHPMARAQVGEPATEDATLPVKRGPGRPRKQSA